ncbi:MAG: glucose-1-phosphate thymidylyltransferase RfbA [Helicobacteraceae bacterium]|jgi:glucose-1-phosphate thymidylyltransferase|nr:glucose-1-phosphate thymidylyltransferase RfbA [Helicobacteraceae bacterium]
MKAIILAGGSGTRLYPITKSVSKQLLPIYDKPMIYYPLSALMLAGLREILIVSAPRDQAAFQTLLGDGSDLGLNISYAVQPNPDGLAQAFIIGEEFIGEDDVCLTLGDNLFYGDSLGQTLQKAIKIVREERKSAIFGYRVADPSRYGVVEFDDQMNVIGVEEKPLKPKSDFAIVGLYFFTNECVKIAKNLKPSERGELEITDVIGEYLRQKRLKAELFGRGFAWLDAGTHESMLEAGVFIETIEKRQGLKVACLEEIAFSMGYISKEKLLELAAPLAKSGYGQYLTRFVRGISRN